MHKCTTYTVCVKTAKKIYKKGERWGKVLNVNKIAEDRKKHTENKSQCHRGLPLLIQKEKKNERTATNNIYMYNYMYVRIITSG